MSIRNFEHQLRMKKEQCRELKNQWGMTLLEIIIVLAIIGVIAAGVVVLAQRAFDSKAMSDLANNANTVRVAIKDAYGLTGRYPAAAEAATAALTPASILTDRATPIGTLVALGKISPDEARNGISGSYINIGPGQIGTRHNAGYYIVLNGLNGRQCRGLTAQLGNQWDYVEVVNEGYPPNAYDNHGEIPFDATVAQAPVDGVIGAVTDNAHVILRSLEPTNGGGLITPTTVAPLCAEGAVNGLILGSR